MRRTIPTLLVPVLAAMLLMAAAPPSAMSDTSYQAADAGRLAGADRVETAAAIAARTFPETATVVYLAGADRFADAMAGGTLADGPVLLTASCDPLPDVVIQALERMDPARVMALGGTEAVCDDVLEQAAEGRRTGRIAGPTRFATAIAIAERGFDDGAETVYLASGGDAPDAMTGGIVTDGPVLLVPPDGGELDDVATQVGRLDPDQVVALGGTAAVTNAQLDAAAGGRDTGRLAGETRFDTAAVIAEHVFPTERGAAAVYLVSGEAYADAVAAGSVTDGPLLLTPGCGDIPDSTAGYLEGSGAHEVVAIGGTAVICDDVLDDAAALITPRLPRPGVFDPRAYDYDAETGPETPVEDMEFIGGDLVLTADDPPMSGFHAENRIMVDGAPDAQLSDCHLPRGVRVHETDLNGHVTVSHCSTGTDTTGLSLTVRHSNLTSENDGVTPTGGAHGQRSLIEYNLIERDGSRAGDAHHDGVQLWQGGNVTIRRNWITGWHTSAILIKSDLEMEPGDGPITDALIEENYLANPTGYYSVYIRDGGFGRPRMVTIRDNAFGPGTPISAGPNPSSQATFVQDESTRQEAIDGGNDQAAEWIVWYGNYDAETGEEVVPPGGWADAGTSP